MQDDVLGRQIDGLGIIDDLIHVRLRNVVFEREHGMQAATVEAANMAAGDAEKHAADLHVGHLLRLDNGGAQVLGDLTRVDHLAFADPEGARLADADNSQPAIAVSPADGHANF